MPKLKDKIIRVINSIKNLKKNWSSIELQVLAIC